ncbi:MAG: lipid A export permease/ATP-binding protein MsbA [Candidatus Dactylopiibacterium carminicum]|uniref:Lipid A export permease/ATP-binding protein MsbA n=1 Tax=Candidatus Dactylopiibacterium carminicum TaxID=857335 RepID=A0A272EYD5_9RHOO|nr:lipid A export permease/ATP-binding protein MsbA [Candidatus Dactylopiibacterium carminicum]KAF7600645.1 lipid A export permease/ATP-binding protein MsbA [Candidatus Dactylopiibacterium carminicum]PAS95121.1 MAG: lipid A export permease/ATP-binding protein MsbA [Candidatus Dactylopiibacterium carminicum]PAT00642.1 MAG: lipid A export permease/ATP-binding protein MsbA [Candidatus Dactylopiibacterium carminicum]
MKESFLLYRRLLAYIKPYWRVSALSILAMAAVAAATPLLSAQFEPLLDESLIARNAEAMWRVPLTILLIACGKSLAEYISSVSSQWVANKAIEDLRRRVFEHQMLLPVATHQAQTSGRMLSRITYDIPQVGAALSTAWIVVIQDSLTVIALLAFLLYKAWHLTLIIFVIGPLVAWIIRKASSGMRTSNRAQQLRMGEMTNAVEEQLAGLREIKIFGTQTHEASRFARIATALRHETMRVVRISSANVPMVQVLAFAAVAVVIFAASSLVESGQLTPGQFVAFIATMAMIFEPIRRLTNINVTIQRGLAGAQSIFELLDLAPEQDAGQRKIERVRGEIRFEGLQFAYPNQASLAVDGFSLTVSPGETVAFVGASGSGKTTLIALVARFFEPQAGQILIDGAPLQQMPLVTLRQQIALVGQHAALFDDSVANNIAYGRQGASMDDIRTAAAQAHALEFIDKLPQGFDTRIGANGNLLSGGQRQRLAIARAFLKDAPILLLDEATSALDNESERVVREALVELRRNRTVLVVAHRLTTIRDAHRIVVMERGRIVETGNHEQLLAANGAYAHLLASGEDIVADEAAPGVG